jgi:plasmid stability protein
MNFLVRNVPDDVVAALDSEAERLGLSRSEYVRRVLTQASVRDSRAVTVEDLAQFGESFAGLGDRDLMDQAWR